MSAANSSQKLATLIGGSGFIGRHLVEQLANEGWRVRVAVRDVEAAKFLKPLGELGQISFVPCDILNDASVTKACEGADLVVNLVGILYERGKRTFKAVHVDGAARVAEAAKAMGAGQMVQISAMGARGDSPAAYAQSKAEGEVAVLSAFPEAVVLRPSVVFGTDDGFFNRFAMMARIMPFLPYFCSDAPSFKNGRFDFWGAGGPKFQPVYVLDVVAAIMKIVNAGNAHNGKTFELGGPHAYTMRQIMELVLHETRRNKLVLPVPMWVAKIKAAFLQYLPVPPLTPDQIKLMETDNVASGDFPGLSDLDIKPTTAEAILPQYLSRFRKLHRHVFVRG